MDVGAQTNTGGEARAPQQCTRFAIRSRSFISYNPASQVLSRSKSDTPPPPLEEEVLFIAALHFEGNRGHHAVRLLDAPDRI